MQGLRNEFRDFLLRVANNNLRPDDWTTFAVQHYSDEELERLRRSLVKCSLDFPEWQVGEIPRLLQDTASELAECIFEFDESSIRYWTEWSEIADDGTIHMKATWIDSESHSTGLCEIPPENADYEFWMWLVSHNELRIGPKTKAEVDSLKSQYRNRA